MYHVNFRLGYDGVERYGPFDYCIEGELSISKFDRIFEHFVEEFSDVRYPISSWKEELTYVIKEFNKGLRVEATFDEWGYEFDLIIKLSICDVSKIPKL